MQKLKYLFLLFVLITTTHSFSQQVQRLEDSLTRNNQRTWHRTDGSRFAKLNTACRVGLEITFYKANKSVILRRCEKGTWKEHRYTFRFITKNENHFVELLNAKNSVAHILEVQVLGNNNKYRTELTFYNIGAKEFYTLVSNGH